MRASRREEEEDCDPRDAMATSGEEQPDCDPAQSSATRGEPIAHIGDRISSNAHPNCDIANVHTTHGETVVEGDPACGTQIERREEIGDLRNARAVQTLMTAQPRI